LVNAEEEEGRAPDAGFAGNVAAAGVGLPWGCKHASAV
jgi:hypothetical protein